MPAYDYVAKEYDGTKIKGSLVISSVEKLEEFLDERDMLLVSFTEQSKASQFFEQFYGNPNDTLMFTLQMATGLPSGLPLIEIIDDLLSEMDPGHFKKVVQDIKLNVEAGNPISQAMGLYPNYFNDIYRVIIRTGEESGHLDEIFQDLVRLLEWDRDLKKQIKGAVRYPIGMLSMLGGLVVLVLTVVLPNFTDLFSQGGTELPGPTLMLMAFGDFMKNYWLLIIIGFIGLISAYKFSNSTPKGRLIIDGIKLKLPFVGDLIKKIAMSRLAHFWKLLFASGVDLAKTLEIVAEVVQNKQLENAIILARTNIINGSPMAAAFKETDAFPGLVLRMINLGETTGAMENSLGKVSEYYDKEVPEAIEGALAAFKPTMMLLMAVILLIVAMAIMLPMFGMIEAVA